MFGSLNHAKNLFFFMQNSEKISVPRGGVYYLVGRSRPPGGGVLFGGCIIWGGLPKITHTPLEDQQQLSEQSLF